MRGFESRVSVHDALTWLTSRISPLGNQCIPVLAAGGRVLAEPVESEFAVPGFVRSMMDGFAVRAADTLGASTYNRLNFTVIGEVLPGGRFGAVVGPREAVRIMTGAPLPTGADAVLPAERVEAVDDEQIFAVDAVSPGRHVGSVGEDVQIGDRVLSAGRRLRPQDLGVLSSIGRAEVDVVARPAVRLIVTGNELLPSGSQPAGTQIVDANSPMLAELVERDGGICLFDGVTPDTPAAIRHSLTTSDADVVLVSGGSSVGKEDYAPRLLSEVGELAIHGIAMRPSSPTGMGVIGDQLVFLLPGNPVSCLCAYDMFAGRAIRGLGGRPRSWPYRRVQLPLRRKLVSAVGRVDYARVAISDGQVEPLAVSGASVLSSTSHADGFVLTEEGSEGAPAGAVVDVWMYDAQPSELE
ncbi:MAG: molybdopterin molybdotransferase MoeA [Pirellulaceae bacterium]|jgi:molybdopterin molybdotransferase|nr:molybdopterin molybdotransferase MoeA [Pirellulaceae bacterium]MDP7016817.1 molybdopterin molybdotransferase MoeA [Pirellulaceae bacterium]